MEEACTTSHSTHVSSTTLSGEALSQMRRRIRANVKAGFCPFRWSHGYAGWYNTFHHPTESLLSYVTTVIPGNPSGGLQRAYSTLFGG